MLKLGVDDPVPLLFRNTTVFVSSANNDSDLVDNAIRKPCGGNHDDFTQDASEGVNVITAHGADNLVHLGNL